MLGPSGCGKSTLLRAIAGLEPLGRGRIPATAAGPGRACPTHKRGFALMFQDGQLFAHLTVARNVGYALRLRRPRRSRRAGCAELLALVGLEGYADRCPPRCPAASGSGWRWPGRWPSSPRLLLLDEPLSALDATLRERLAGDLREILRAAGTTALLVTHDHEEAFAVADRLAVMRAGRVVQAGADRRGVAAPVDAETALFLGYARVLPAARRRRVLAGGGLRRPGDAVAVRRSALVVDRTGRCRARVVSARVTPEQVRLVVRRRRPRRRRRGGAAGHAAPAGRPVRLGSM